MTGYYNENLSAGRLNRVYEIAPPRVRQYLQAEVDYVLGKIQPGDAVLELGCGCGRILPELSSKAGIVIGIDTSLASLREARNLIENRRGESPDSPVSREKQIALARMDAVRLAFANDSFNCVVCIQNGISAFHVDQRALIEEAVRVSKPGGPALFSTYSEKFWEDRLEWFRLQAEEGLLGEIDEAKTGNGVIVCKDGFTATTVSPERFRELTANLKAEVRLEEVDESSLFCEVISK